MRGIARRLAIAIFGLLAATAAQAQPVTIHLGIGVAVEEPVWLLLARPDLAAHQGKDYRIEMSRFSGADKRIQAFEAGALDIATASANGALFAAAEGIDFKIIASLSRESTRGFVTEFMSKDSSRFDTLKDLKGAKIAINGFSGSGHLWTRAALATVGLSENDVTLVPLPFSVMDDAVRSGMVDVGMFPQPFAAAAEAKPGLRKVYTSKDAAPYEEELTMLIAKNEFLAAHASAVRAFLADVVAATQFYAAHPVEARQALIDAKLVHVEPAVYLHMGDYYRDPGNKVDVGALEKMQDLQVAAGFQKNRADLGKLVDLSYLPN